MSEFKREKRYQVTKLSNPNWNGSCVVVEDDWPEYEIVWKMIQDRVEGKPNIIDQQAAQIAKLESLIKEHSEPVAWHDKNFNVELFEYREARVYPEKGTSESQPLFTHPILEK